MILKFGTKLDSDELYCVKKKPHIAYQSLYLFIFFQILCTPSGRLSVLCK